jgi:hypothetical protein
MNSKSNLLSQSILFKPGAAVLMLSLAAACSDGGSSGGSAAAPTILSNSPLRQASGVPVNGKVSATFSEAMDSTTLTTTTFTLTLGPTAIPVPGTVIYANSKAVFWPAAHLADNGAYTATITTGALNPSGVGLKTNHVWSFTTGNTLEPGSTVDLGAAGDFAILAKAGISTVPASDITGDLGISPAAASFITGFALTLDASNLSSTSSQVTGKVFAADYAAPTPANMTTSILDMETAFTDAAGRAPDVTELGAGNIGGMTLVPGVYKWGTGLLIPTDVTLNGNATDVWVFQIAQDLTVSNATSVVLAGGARPENVFWQVTGLVDLGTTAEFKGIILGATAITLRTGASINGRLLAQTAVNIDACTVVEPAL